ncbi:hypothetical protein AAMO2058_000472700 [Amorphochlora amoebiformis]
MAIVPPFGIFLACFLAFPEISKAQVKIGRRGCTQGSSLRRLSARISMWGPRSGRDISSVRAQPERSSNVMDRAFDAVGNTLTGMSRRQLFLTLAGGSIALFGLTKPRQGPPLWRGDGMVWTRTKGGEPLAIFKDEYGRIYMVDKYSNLYYDTGEPETGFFIVDREGVIRNVFIDTSGEVQRITVGNVSELQTFRLENVEGIDPRLVSALPNGGEMTAFTDILDEKKLKKVREMAQKKIVENPEMFKSGKGDDTVKLRGRGFGTDVPVIELKDNE